MAAAPDSYSESPATGKPPSLKILALTVPPLLGNTCKSGGIYAGDSTQSAAVWVGPSTHCVGVLVVTRDMWCLQAGLADITQSLKNYRPSVTVLEAQMAPSRRGEGAGGTGAPGLTAANGPDGGLVAVMEQKRNAHDQAIKVSIRSCVYICKLGCFVCLIYIAAWL